MKRILILLLVALFFTGCTIFPGNQQYNVTYLDVFDTVTTIVGQAESQDAFTTSAKAVHDALLEYHRLFDIYNEYDGLVTLKTVNDHAGISPVQVDQKIISLLLKCKEIEALTNGKVNAAMGSVLQLWHEARTQGLADPENAKLPAQDALEEAAKHTNFDCIVIDTEHSTVFFTDPLLKLDVGAIAKGWAVQQVAENTPAGFLISVGGNVYATGPKDSQGTPWRIGVQNPDGEEYLQTISITGGCIATSGDYQRTYTVDGTAYHHIIDPDTLYPSTLWRSVTVYCADSAMADALTTALFLLSIEDGEAMLEQCGALGLWVDRDGQQFYSPGLSEYLT